MADAERQRFPREGRPNRTQGQRTLTAVEAEEDILRISREIDDLLDELVNYAREKAVTEHAYGLKKAKENLVASTKEGSGRGGGTTVDERESHVTIACEKEWMDNLVAEAFYNTCKERIHAKRDQVRSLQTICANIRSAAGYG